MLFHCALKAIDNHDTFSYIPLTHDLEGQLSSPTGSSELLMGVSLGKTLQSSSLVVIKPRKYMKMLAVAMNDKYY